MSDPDTDSDGDGLADCDEEADGDPWTDKDIFNGMRASLMHQCSGTPGCSRIDTEAEIDACVANSSTHYETRDQSAGWSWSAPTTPQVCDPGHGFAPQWSAANCSQDKWQIDWTGYIDLSAGNHCFTLIGGTSSSCTSFLFEGALMYASQALVDRTQCFDVSAGAYPIRWFHIMDDSRSSGDLQILYCEGGASSCTPSEVLPASRLRPSL